MGGDIDGQDVARVEAGSWPVLTEAFWSNMLAACEEYEGPAICGTAKMRRRRLVLPESAHWPLDKPNHGSRRPTAGAGQTPGAQPHHGQPAPTHNMLASTVKSSARTEKREP